MHSPQDERKKIKLFQLRRKCKAYAIRSQQCVYVTIILVVSPRNPPKVLNLMK